MPAHRKKRRGRPAQKYLTVADRILGNQAHRSAYEERNRDERREKSRQRRSGNTNYNIPWMEINSIERAGYPIRVRHIAKPDVKPAAGMSSTSTDGNATRFIDIIRREYHWICMMLQADSTEEWMLQVILTWSDMPENVQSASRKVLLKFLKIVEKSKEISMAEIAQVDDEDEALAKEALPIMSTTPWYLNVLVNGAKVKRSPEFLAGGHNKPPIPFVIEVKARDDGKRLATMLDNTIRPLSDRDRQDGGRMYQVLCSAGVTAAFELTFRGVQNFYTILFGHRITLYISEEHALSSLLSSPKEYRRGYKYANFGPALEALLTHGNMADDPLPWATDIENHTSQPHIHGWFPRNTPETPRPSTPRAPRITEVIATPSRHPLKTASTSHPGTPARTTASPPTSRTSSPSTSALFKGKAPASTSARVAIHPLATARSADLPSTTHTQSQPSTSATTARTPQSRDRRRNTAGAGIVGSPAQTVWQQLFYSYASIYLSRNIRQILYSATTYPEFVQRLEDAGIAEEMTAEMLTLAWRFYSAAVQDDTITVLSDSDGDD
ncbi:hypothetical protein CYLTODRAFT_445819 [Cylindrobasidium torrendii FP15055 ss-10]|uniref:Uncharacterized protein n=1 Tax=Cylindrobasidium torrendii FP15055 ss-10 TaxID=1314674 RepID=A0A0D7B294_9AGAR|nr:hypothetical protein CYLTODRAFT_445819 [Cylindrobasidium torrendii FP15055 ss-10]